MYIAMITSATGRTQVDVYLFFLGVWKCFSLLFLTSSFSHPPSGISMPVPVFGLQDDSKVFKKDMFKKDICLLADENFVLVGSFVAFFIPLTIMVVTYFLTIKSLQKEAMLCVNDIGPKTKFTSFSFLPQSSLSSEKLFQRSLNRDSGTSGRRTMQSISNEQKASKVLGIVFFLFVVMWCPFFITNVMAVICKESCKEEVIGGLLNIFVWIGYLSSAVNPLVYTLFNKTYRSAFSRYIQCRYKEEKKPLQLILVNTIPALAYDSRQLQLAQMKSLKKETKMMSKDYSAVTIGTHRLDGTSKGSTGPGNEKVSGVWWSAAAMTTTLCVLKIPPAVRSSDSLGKSAVFKRPSNNIIYSSYYPVDEKQGWKGIKCAIFFHAVRWLF